MSEAQARGSVHTPDDGRGLRRIFVDGREIKYVFYADTRRGVVRAFRHPFKLNRWGKRLLDYTLRGAVRIDAAE